MIRRPLILAVAITALFSTSAFAQNLSPKAQYTYDTKQASTRYADDKKLCAEETSSKARMQCLRDAKSEYDQAINLIRQAIETFPKDIEAYLESGRLYIRKKEYGRALSRFGQAADLFSDVPAPNKEIGNLRLLQVKEKIEGGADHRSARGPRAGLWQGADAGHARSGAAGGQGRRRRDQVRRGPRHRRGQHCRRP